MRIPLVVYRQYCFKFSAILLDFVESISLFTSLLNKSSFIANRSHVRPHILTIGNLFEY